MDDDKVNESIKLFDIATMKGKTLIPILKEFIRAMNEAEEYCRMSGLFYKTHPDNLIEAQRRSGNTYEVISNIIKRKSE